MADIQYKGYLEGNKNKLYGMIICNCDNEYLCEYYDNNIYRYKKKKKLTRYELLDFKD